MRRTISRLKRRLAGSSGPDLDAELRWWLERWNPVIQDGGFNPGDVTEYLDDGEGVAPTYEGRRWQIARAEVRRVLREASIEDPDYFAGKVVVDIGPGPLGFPDACPAKVSMAIEPLAERFASHSLLLRSDAVYLPVGAERIPLLAESVDVMLSRNSLDHVSDPQAVVGEVTRVLRPGGVFILNVDMEHAATATEPHVLDLQQIRSMLAHMELLSERIREHPHGGEGRTLIAVARKRQGS